MAEVVGLRGRVLEEIPVGVDRRLEVVLRDRRPDRLAVDVDEHGGRLAEEDGRWIGLEALDVLRNHQARVQVREDTVEREHALVVRQRRDDLRDDGLERFALDRGEVGLDNLEVREVHEPLVDGHAGIGFHLDGAESRLLRGRGQVRQRGVHDGLFLIRPADELWLVHHERGFAGRRVAARPAAVGRRGRGCGRGGRGLRARRLCLHERSDRRSDQTEDHEGRNTGLETGLRGEHGDSPGGIGSLGRQHKGGCYVSAGDRTGVRSRPASP